MLASSLWLRARHFLRYELEHFFWSFLREWKQINFPKFVWNSCNIWWKPLASFMAILVFLTQFKYTEDQTIIGLFSQPITIWDFKTKRATSMENVRGCRERGRISYWLHEMLCSIWYHLHILKNVKNTHGGLLLLVEERKVQEEKKFIHYFGNISQGKGCYNQESHCVMNKLPINGHIYSFLKNCFSFQIKLY